MQLQFHSICASVELVFAIVLVFRIVLLFVIAVI